MQPAFSTEQLTAARARITEGGKPISEWAQENSLDLGMVYHMLTGRSRGVRGESYRVAAALGLRKAPTKKRSAAKAGQQAPKQAAA